MSTDNKPVQARVPAYHRWVIEHLAQTGGGTFALTPSAVLAGMIRDWILDHEEFLRARQLDEASFRRPAAVRNDESPPTRMRAARERKR
jgi:hypothetical protein